MAGPVERGNRKLKWIDRWLGIPLIFLCGIPVRFLRRLFGRAHPIPPLTPTRIGVLITAAIGDTILFSAVLRDLQACWPGAQFVLFIGSSNRAMRELITGVDVIEIAATHPISAMSAIRHAGYFDLFIDTGQWARLNALLTLTAKAGWRIGFQTPHQARHYGFDCAVPHRSDSHELENFRRLARAVQVETTHLPHFQNETMKAEAAATLAPPPADLKKRHRPYAVFHMFAGGLNPYQKEWPLESWFLLATQLPAHWDIIITGGKENRPDAQTFLSFIENKKLPPALQSRFLSEVGTLTLAETTELLRSAKIVVSVNTGILHLAAATDVPTVGLHGPTSALRWGPVGAQTSSVSSPRPCSPCLNLGFDYGCPLDACMREITVADAWTAVELAIKKDRRDSPVPLRLE